MTNTGIYAGDLKYRNHRTLVLNWILMAKAGSNRCFRPLAYPEYSGPGLIRINLNPKFCH